MSEPGIGPELLERWALGYLERFASSADNLRRVLTRRVRRRAADAEAAARAAPLIEALVARYCAAGLVDDTAYAEARTASLRRRGDSARAIRAKLAAKGVAPAVAAAALDGGADAELAAACAFARRRRLGPFRRHPEPQQNELAAFARAGFARAVAEAVLGCRDEAAVAALAEDPLRR